MIQHIILHNSDIYLYMKTYTGQNLRQKIEEIAYEHHKNITYKLCKLFLGNKSSVKGILLFFYATILQKFIFEKMCFFLLLFLL